MSESIYHLRIALRHSKPPIWRRVAVPGSITLGELHEVIQIAMGWMNCHLHHFMLRDAALKPSREEIRKAATSDMWNDAFFSRMRGQRIFVSQRTPDGEPLDMEGEDEDAVTLAEVCGKVKSKLVYEYDFGDGWEHMIEVQKITPAEADVEYPVCLAGKLACPPEDCGGVHGYYHLLAVAGDPKHEDHKDMVEWLGGTLDPEAFDIDGINAELAEWRKARARPKRKLRLSGD